MNARATPQATTVWTQPGGELGRFDLEHRGELLAHARGVGAALGQHRPRGTLQRRRDRREQHVLGARAAVAEPLGECARELEQPLRRRRNTERATRPRRRRREALDDASADCLRGHAERF